MDKLTRASCMCYLYTGGNVSAAHLLGKHDVVIYEVRTKEGYGARWSIKNGLEFRGFIEPVLSPHPWAKMPSFMFFP